MLEFLAILVLIGLVVALHEHIMAGVMIIAGLAVVLGVGFGVILGGIYLYDEFSGVRTKRETESRSLQETWAVCDVLASEQVRNLCHSGDQAALRAANATDMLAA